ncbi:uncharacterized protein LOC124918160 [Impatiens glandulifera]|uniref:uncharacterized protein LOC124918160 n=1 Tax=Impatiens glandulifera TaxID=253017 RepID=UPI001FB0C36B|nr:uncharacterized protein LOC124918160 [Impatiens glandulifera]
MSTVRTFLAVVAVRDWHLLQMNVHNSFLHGDLKEEVYMHLPLSFEFGHNNKVCRLHIISECGFLGAKPAGFPMEHNYKLGELVSAQMEDLDSYRRLDHYQATLWVVRYLKNAPLQGILLRSDCDLRLSGWCDSDWASSPKSHRLVTG